MGSNRYSYLDGNRRNIISSAKTIAVFFRSGSRDHATVDWVLGKTAQDILAGSNTIVMNFLEDNGQPLIFPGDNIGIVLDSGYVFWTTVASSMIQDLANPYLAVDDKGTPLY